MPVGINLFRVKTRARCKIISKLTMKTPERQNQRRFGVLIGNFEQIIDLILNALLFDFEQVNDDFVKF